MSRDNMIRLSDKEYNAVKAVHRMMDGEGCENTPIGSAVGRLAQEYLSEEDAVFVRVFSD